MFEKSNVVRIPVTGSASCNFLECEVRYSLGGYNVFTYTRDPRGYYVSCTPVTVDGNMVSFTCFSGIKRLVKEVGRRSDKAAKEAAAAASAAVVPLIEAVCAKNGLDAAKVLNTVTDLAIAG